MLPTDPQSRKNTPLLAGIVSYFPDAWCVVGGILRRSATSGEAIDATEKALFAHLIREEWGMLATVALLRLQELSFGQVEDCGAIREGDSDVLIAVRACNMAAINLVDCSTKGTTQHDLGALYWDREKSSDDADSLFRHLIEYRDVDSDGTSHATKVAWRGLACLQRHLESIGEASLSRYNKVDSP